MTSKRTSPLAAIDPHIGRLWIFLGAVAVLFLILRPASFLSPITWQSMGIQFPEFGLMALGVMLAMITGGIDLSSVGVANMSAIASASVMLAIAPPEASGSGQLVALLVGIVVALTIGALAGALNGVLVAKVKIPAILVTLGSLELFTGIGIILSQGRPISGLPPIVSSTLGAKILGIPVQLLIFALVAALIWVLLHKMAFGSKLYMLGSNPTAAKFSGLNSTALLIQAYTLSGVCAAIAGLVMMANYNSAKADYGVAYTLLTVLIVVLGGVNPLGGSGRLLGVLLAIAILQILSSGLNMFPEISNFYRPLIWGAVLLIVISTGGSGKNFWSALRRKGTKNSEPSAE